MPSDPNQILDELDSLEAEKQKLEEDYIIPKLEKAEKGSGDCLDKIHQISFLSGEITKSLDMLKSVIKESGQEDEEDADFESDEETQKNKLDYTA